MLALGLGTVDDHVFDAARLEQLGRLAALCLDERVGAAEGGEEQHALPRKLLEWVELDEMLALVLLPHATPRAQPLRLPKSNSGFGTGVPAGARAGRRQGSVRAGARARGP
eukprot:5679372-Prymnesium_polylepis.1